MTEEKSTPSLNTDDDIYSTSDTEEDFEDALDELVVSAGQGNTEGKSAIAKDVSHSDTRGEDPHNIHTDLLEDDIEREIDQLKEEVEKGFKLNESSSVSCSDSFSQKETLTPIVVRDDSLYNQKDVKDCDTSVHAEVGATDKGQNNTSTSMKSQCESENRNLNATDEDIHLPDEDEDSNSESSEEDKDRENEVIIDEDALREIEAQLTEEEIQVIILFGRTPNDITTLTNEGSQLGFYEGPFRNYQYKL